MIEVFATSRQVRAFYDNFSDQNAILPKAITIADFESKAWFVPDLSEASSDMRLLLMKKACDFSNFKKLHIPEEFMAFLQNSDYLFGFFEELANEEVELDELDMRDTYAEFVEHIAILKELLARYGQELLQNGLYDAITKPKIAQINASYLNSLKFVRIHLEGFLSRFEIRLLQQAQKFCNIYITTALTPYNQKTRSLLENFGIKTEPNTLIECLLNDQKLISSEPYTRGKKPIKFQTFSARALQAAFVFEKIEEFVKSGLAPENIAVVLPDESFAAYLKELDRFNNLNFAMGFALNLSGYCQRLGAVIDKDDEIEQIQRLKRLEINDNTPLQTKVGVLEIISFLKSFLRENDEKKERKIVEEELFLFEKFLQNAEVSLELEQAAVLFLQRIANKKIDDVSGGKISVIGILEGRGARFDGVIIVDFNDDIVPKRNSKDMFISSKLREKAGLPSIEDRENLQRFFYDRLLNSAKMSAICCVQNDDKIPSRFLKNLNISDEQKDENSYKNILFPPSADKKEQKSEKNFTLKHDFFAYPLSSSRLKNFLDCKRRYYFLYIKKFEEPKIASDEYNAAELGSALHELLREFFSQEPNFVRYSKANAAKRLKEILQERGLNSAVWELEADIWALKLEKLFEIEQRRADEGWRVFALEQKFETEFEGMKLSGRIDRIDEKQGEFLLIDYKSAKLGDEFIESSEKKALQASNFQLEFYSLLFSRPSKAFFYDLNSAQMIENPFFGLKQELLIEHLRALKSQELIEFSMTEEPKKCKYCPFTKLCERPQYEI